MVSHAMDELEINNSGPMRRSSLMHMYSYARSLVYTLLLVYGLRTMRPHRFSGSVHTDADVVDTSDSRVAVSGERVCVEVLALAAPVLGSTADCVAHRACETVQCAHRIARTADRNRVGKRAGTAPPTVAGRLTNTTVSSKYLIDRCTSTRMATQLGLGADTHPAVVVGGRTR
jgi:hypothetical protein